MLTKNCHKCLTPQPIEMYWKDRASKDGLFSVCKTCGRENNATKYHRDIDKERERNAAWREANKDRIAMQKAALRSERRKWIVYQLDFPDGCYYIGSTCDFTSRMTLHRHEMRKGQHRNPHIRAAGYGPDDFKAVVVLEVGSKEEARHEEGRLIASHKDNPKCLNSLGLSLALFSACVA